MGVADVQFVLGRAQSLIRKVSPSVPFPEGVSNPTMGAGCSYLSAEAGDQQQGHFYAFSGGWHRAPLHSSDARLAGGGRMQKQGPAWEIAAVSGGSLTSSPKPLTCVPTASQTFTGLGKSPLALRLVGDFKMLWSKILFSTRSKFKCKPRLWYRFYRKYISFINTGVLLKPS